MKITVKFLLLTIVFAMPLLAFSQSAGRYKIGLIDLMLLKRQKLSAVALAKELGVVIIASLFEKRAHGLYHNTTAVLDADATHLARDREQEFIAVIMLSAEQLDRLRH